MTIIVVSLGIILVVVSMLWLFLPYGEKYKTTTQKFSGLGVQLEISLLTVLALLGVGMVLVPVLVPVYWGVQQVSRQLEQATKETDGARGEIKALQLQLGRAQKFDVWALVGGLR